MCTCASCVATDKLHDAGFAAWPRGNPAGRKSASEYAAHVRHGLAWGGIVGAAGRVIPRKPEFPGGVKLTPLQYQTPGRGDPGPLRSYPTLAAAEEGTAHYVAAFIAANNYVTPEKAAELAKERAAYERAKPKPAKRVPHLVQLARDLRAAEKMRRAA